MLDCRARYVGMRASDGCEPERRAPRTPGSIANAWRLTADKVRTTRRWHHLYCWSSSTVGSALEYQSFIQLARLARHRTRYHKENHLKPKNTPQSLTPSTSHPSSQPHSHPPHDPRTVPSPRTLSCSSHTHPTPPQYPGPARNPASPARSSAP